MKMNGLGWSVFGLTLGTIAWGAAVAVAEPVTRLESMVGQPHNGLSSKAFRHNMLTTNSSNLQALLDHPLGDLLFQQGELHKSLQGPYEQAMLAELVKCALDAPGHASPEQESAITVADASGTPLSFQGELGLCPQWYSTPLGKLPTCQERITACVMARVNAVEKSIPISLRSASPPLTQLHDRVPTDTRLREGQHDRDPKVGWLIASFARTCSGLECGWSAANVGRCTPGEEVQLAIEDRSDPSACYSLRVCTGLYGCTDYAFVASQLPDGSAYPSYSKRIPEQAGERAGTCNNSRFTFRCPDDKATGGYYSVMVRPRQISPSSQKLQPTIVKIQGEGAYPAPEKAVFSYSEGAFYGNLFEPNRLQLPYDLSSCEAALGRSYTPGDCERSFSALPYKDVYACYTSQIPDDLNVDVLNDRLCDLPEGKANCFPQPPKRCQDTTLVTSPGSHCTATGKDGAYRSCANPIDGTKIFTQIISTYLNDPCDLIHHNDLCAKVRQAIAPPVLCGCGGCSRRGGLPLISTLVLVVLVLLFVLRRTRRRAG